MSTAFEKFAPALLKVYYRDKEAFWAAVMAPFLDNRLSLLDWWKTLRVDVGLLSAFRGLDGEARQKLSDFSAPFGFDVAHWDSNRAQYLKDAYPIFAFLAVWMDEQGMHDLMGQFAGILTAGLFAIAGYGILDANVDKNTPSPVEILTAQAMISEYETRALRIFGVTPVNLEIMYRMRRLFLEAEIKEKQARGKTNPYRLDQPEQLGAKGANAVTPFMLCLEQLGKADQIDDYWEVFLLFGAVIQMVDDWQDLEGDLAAGHYSYVTLGMDGSPAADPKETARRLRGDQKRVRDTYTVCRAMIDRSRLILDALGDSYLGRFVDVTELRLENYYRKELKMA